MGMYHHFLFLGSSCYVERDERARENFKREKERQNRFFFFFFLKEIRNFLRAIFYVEPASAIPSQSSAASASGL